MKRNAKVYVMSRDDGAVKVGCSIHPGFRMWQVGGSRVDFESDVIDEAERVERLAHKLLATTGKRIGRHGEWFRTTVEDAIQAIARARRIIFGQEPMPEFPKSKREKTRTIPLAVPLEVIGVVDEIIAKRRHTASRPEVLREMLLRRMEIEQRRVA